MYLFISKCQVQLTGKSPPGRGPTVDAARVASIPTLALALALCYRACVGEVASIFIFISTTLSLKFYDIDFASLCLVWRTFDI